MFKSLLLRLACSQGFFVIIKSTYLGRAGLIFWPTEKSGQGDPYPLTDVLHTRYTWAVSLHQYMKIEGQMTSGIKYISI